MTDAYSHLKVSLESPATRAAAVTPHATDELPGGVTRGLYVGVGGNIAMVLGDDSAAVTFVGATAGSVLVLRVKAVRVSGTTATNLIALY